LVVGPGRGDPEGRKQRLVDGASVGAGEAFGLQEHQQPAGGVAA